MYQEIIALSIVAAAVIYVIWSVAHKKKKKRPASCGDCTGCSCELASLKKDCKMQN